MDTTMTEVTFTAGDVTLTGVLRVPDSEPGAQLPALVFTGPFTGVKEQVTGIYAELLAQRGFVTLAFDHRNFGASGGKVRQHEDPAGKLEDLAAATSELSTNEWVDPDRVGCVGICLGGGYALRASAFDRRHAATACIAGAYGDPRARRSAMGDDTFRSRLEAFFSLATKEQSSGEVEYMKAVTNDESEAAAMPGDEPYAYYGTDRAAAEGWSNRVTKQSGRELMTFDSAIGADFISPTPVLFVHGKVDRFCSPEGAQSAFDRVQGEKDFVWLDCEKHIDLYDNDEYVTPAVDAVAEWMNRHL